MAVARKMAPEIPGDLEWFNTPVPLSLTRLRGTLVVLAFVDSSSVDSLHVIDELDRLGYRFQGRLLILCVHLPGLPAASRRSHVQAYIHRNVLRFPLVHDPEYLIAARYGICSTPALVLIDRDGLILGSLNGPRELGGLQAVISHRLSLHPGRELAGGMLPLPAVADPESRRPLRFPGRIVLAGDRMYVSDSGHNRILVLTRQGNVIRQYGAQVGGFIDGIGDAAAFRNPQGLTVQDDFLYVADAGNHAIRRVNLINDEVVTVAGNGSTGLPIQPQQGYPADRPMHTPLDVTGEVGRLFIAMAGVHQVWSLSLLTNTVELLAGCGKHGQVDGKPGLARFAQPSGLALCERTVYCTDALSCALRRIDAETGRVGTLVAGRERTPEATRGAGRADSAGALQYPQAVVVDGPRQRLWIADSYNDRVCRLDIRSGRLSIPLPDADLREPAGLAISDDTLYIASTNAHAIVRVQPGQAPVEILNVSEEHSEF